jgi:F0F1-type ATP synthase membrane subunit b/b'
MERILDLLGPLFLGALPTVILVFVLFFFLRWAFWHPLERVLAQRQAATEGAHRDAEGILRSADDKVRHYQEALRQARAEIYREQEASRQAALDERNRILQENRRQANEKLRQAKLEIHREVEDAKQALEAESQRLAEQIARRLLASAGPSGKPQ